MKAMILLAVFVCASVFGAAQARDTLGRPHRHYSHHGGHYVGGYGSSHRGGTYRSSHRYGTDR